MKGKYFALELTKEEQNTDEEDKKRKTTVIEW